LGGVLIAEPVHWRTLLSTEALPPKHALEVLARQINAVFMQSPMTTIGSLIAGVALVYGMAGAVPSDTLSLWLAALCVHQGLRIYHYASYRKANPRPADMDRWGKRYKLTSITSGLIWGSAGYLMFVPDSPQHQTLLLIVLFGVSSVTAISLSSYAPAFFIIVPLAIVPAIVRLITEGQPIFYFMAVLVTVLLTATLIFGRNMNRLITNSLVIRFENMDLIEELRRQTDIARQALHEAEDANRSKTQFFAAASHDLRQPLHAMGLFASALYQKVKDPEVLHVVRSINDSVAALEGLFNELLDISKIDAGAVKPELRHVALAGVLDRVRLDFSAEASHKGIELKVMPTRAFVHSDPVLLERILRNLVSNAIRHTPAGRVLVGCRHKAGSVRIEVWDTGLGIAPEQRTRIFEEFYQIGNPERSSKRGMGLGLSIVQRLAQLLGHPIALDSRPGKGTVFRVDVPLGLAPTTEGVPVRTVAPEPQDLSGRLFVVVDDEAAIVQGMQVLLESWGARVIGSQSGEDVLARVLEAEQLPDLIIADYRLGGGAVGTEVIDRLRNDLDPEIPALLITGSTAPERVQESELHRYDLLYKPVQPERLRAAIHAKLRPAPGFCP
jgi:two-component system, sensor histidine kinase